MLSCSSHGTDQKAEKKQLNGGRVCAGQQLKGLEQSRWERHGGRSLRQLLTLNLQSGGRGQAGSGAERRDIS